MLPGRAMDQVLTGDKAAEAGALVTAEQPNRRLWARFGMPLTVFVCLMGSWEALIWLLDVPGFLVPAPSAIVQALWSGLVTGLYFSHAAVTMFEAVVGFAIGSLLGLALGTVIVVFPTMERIVYPYVVALQTVPKVAIAPLMVVWFGFGITSKILVVALVSLFPVLVNVMAGLRSIDQDRLDLLGALAASRWQIFRYVRFPNALPFIFAGLNTAIVLAVIGAIVAEFVGSNYGLGFLILQANYQLDIAGAFSLFVVLSVMGVALHGSLKWLERRCVFWINIEARNGL
ncbi:ABC transporter permease [Phreatobacter stygius]|uniref:ABC transporter permease n=2 Tax=Phreatobacter stygius TaxID=1940610 RepID=A0A4D7B247_9HYPH|nr:ABC transporter permease [Phreatobacter stygius]